MFVSILVRSPEVFFSSWIQVGLRGGSTKLKHELAFKGGQIKVFNKLILWGGKVFFVGACMYKDEQEVQGQGSNFTSSASST